MQVRSEGQSLGYLSWGMHVTVEMCVTGKGVHAAQDLWEPRLLNARGCVSVCGKARQRGFGWTASCVTPLGG